MASLSLYFFSVWTNLWILLGVLHDLAPDALHGLVAFALDRQLADDVLGGEDGLQVEPRALTHEPLVEHVLRVWARAGEPTAQGGRERATSEGAGGPAERRGRGQAGLRLLRAGHPASGHKLVAPLVTRVITRLVTRVLGAAAEPSWCGGGHSGREAGGVSPASS